ncbi:MAG: carbon-nitrogen hydrolase family protein [Eubacteriales bacterium]|jgi:predicted amidohydrolase|nr:carbon-nitrogen hydrolase family protein [Eubacteriales bacterium]MDD4139737.1 carbon-nitrogen hydrolase family protein [Eubacteriales bacterium]NLO36709.1 carbon-nitrogen hydrolase family protein [Clostridiaceae bacterium]
MARFVTISAVAPRPHEMDPKQDLNASVAEMIAHWDGWLSHVLCDKPDLIVLPEACDRPPNFTLEQRLAYYAVRGNRIRDHFMAVARDNHCNIAYSAARQLPDGTWRNTTQFINRQGELDGFYNKNHLTHGEFYDAHILYGKDAPVIKTDFGTVAGVICFDLNYQELLQKYEKSRPELLVFCSMYHGGLMQNIWAYTCRSFFVGSVPGNQCTIINPVGDLVAQSTNYYPFVTAQINLDHRVVHIDYNTVKFPAIKQKYGRKVKIYDPGHLGCVLMTCEAEDLTMADIVREFELELWDDYYARSMAERHMPGHIEP